MRFGFEAREKQDNSRGYGNSSGSFLFNGQYTTQTLNGGPGFGNDLASFMLGIVEPKYDRRSEYGYGGPQHSGRPPRPLLRLVLSG